MERLLDRLFIESKTYLAPLQGSELDTDLEGSPMLLSPTSTDSFLVNLHLALNKAHPEAGAPYWRVRSWGLSCWQPIYLALICVHRLRAVPSSLNQLHQYQQKTYISGYALPDGAWLSGEPTTLIHHAAVQLRTLFDALQAAHIKTLGGRKELYQALLADQIMLTIVSMVGESATIDGIKNEYRLWAKGLDLPTEPLRSLYQESGEITFRRRTCCLHFRREDGELCADCPRHHKEKTKQRIPCLN